jgi:diaminopimelate epimerase
MQISKYSASGNDFVIFHTIKEQDFSSLAKKLCDRNSGVGADGLIVLVPHEILDFKWLFYNSDGSYAAMCGNGSRACAHYAFSEKIAGKIMSFLTGAGPIECKVEGDIVTTLFPKERVLKESFKEEGFEWVLLDTGVPHLVTFVEDLESFDKNLASKMRYKYDANVNFAKLEDTLMRVRTYERGVEDETLACGTGMAACFIESLKKQDSESLRVYPKSNEELFFKKVGDKVYYKGRVKRVFDIIAPI